MSTAVVQNIAALYSTEEIAIKRDIHDIDTRTSFIWARVHELQRIDTDVSNGKIGELEREKDELYRRRDVLMAKLNLIYSAGTSR